ncbi:hypothetical protein ACWDTT_33315 [Streptosporangium sandarakinum]
MFNHRTTPTKNYTPLRNSVLQDHRLTYAARGLLADLLSRKNGTKVDIKGLSSACPDTQQAIAKGYAELVKYGYVVRRRVKNPDTGKITTEIHVYDVPQVAEAPEADLSLITPSLSSPSLGSPSPFPSGEKTGETNPPSHTPPAPKAAEPEPKVPGGRLAEIIEEETPETAQCVQILAGLGRRYEQLHLGRREMSTLIPMVAEWLRRGATAAHIYQVMGAGLPPKVNSPKAFLTYRLGDKLPVPPVLAEQASAPVAALPTCPECARPGLVEGVCADCSGRRTAPAPAVSGTQLSALEQMRRDSERARAAFKASYA